jgi:hypothetical protein
MTDFLKDCYFNGFRKGRKNFVPTPRYAKKIRAMPRLPPPCGIARSRFSVFKKFYLRLRAMQLNVKFKSKFFLSTRRYAAQRGVDSTLCRIAQSCNSALCGTARSRDSPLCGIARSQSSSSNISANSNLYAKPF